MPRKKLTVHRKGFTFKKGKAKGKRVKPKTYKIPDRGAPGRGKKIIPKLKKGGLGITFDMSMMEQKRILKNKAMSRGEKKVTSSLIALETLNKRQNPKVSRRAKELAHWVAGSFRGRRYVGYPRGLSENYR